MNCIFVASLWQPKVLFPQEKKKKNKTVHMVSSKPSTSRIKHGCQVIPRGPNGWHLEGRIESPQFHYPHLCLYRHWRRERWNGKESPEISLGGRRGCYEPHESLSVRTSLTRGAPFWWEEAKGCMLNRRFCTSLQPIVSPKPQILLLKSSGLLWDRAEV